MRWLAALVLAALAGVPDLAGAQASAGADDADSLAIGRRIYREGILPSGQPLQGASQAGVTLSGTGAACATCHRRSGYGSSEGPIEVRAITGPALFGERVAPPAPASALDSKRPGAAHPLAAPAGNMAAEQARADSNALRAARAAMFTGTRQRPTYDDASLAHALHDGIDVTGRTMNRSMPRYTLDPAAFAAITAYLKMLSAEVSPGVSEDQVHFATVFQPDTDAAQRRAVVEVVQTIFRDRNLSQRSEQRRERAGQVHLGRTYREWMLDVWELQGASDSWGAQLEAHNHQQPVFALVSGLGSSSWRPIHEFSERFEVPCILPQTEVPELNEPDFYTVYLSKGMTLEAQALAKYLRDSGEQGPVTQVFGHDDASATAAAAFRKAWTAGARAGLVEQEVDAAPSEAFWQQFARQSPGGTLVLWLAAPQLAQAQSLTSAVSPVKAVYLSSGLLDGHSSAIKPDAKGRLRLVYPEDLPAAREARLAVVKRWMHDNGIAPGDEKVLVNAYLAATATGMMVTHSKDTYSREFLVERMEHRLGTANELSIYPHLSLGPGQRFASKGSYIMQIGGEDYGQLTPLSDWIVP